ncbi:histone-lysine N-methyltransferase [Rhynchospora pubera]|uniref:Histone-lysine N-methyltransferase n=1 Tax=Rhynchospora pubera TaxID=906938 RepID=A0AAV8C266_9POAL|nr:histone-lysine N-methyltransferase [Rhynchospora pubera]KAJ4797554.1 histone-lysine N-methyltransferase [Rhynchospora pubera]
MRGVGGPLLCIGDLLCDVADDDVSTVESQEIPSSSSASPTSLSEPSSPSDLNRLFEEHYNELVKSLDGNDHSWTNLMVKLCATLKIADKLVVSADSNVQLLLEKVAMLESLLKRGDSIVKALEQKMH